MRKLGEYYTSHQMFYIKILYEIVLSVYINKPAYNINLIYVIYNIYNIIL
jgi:hypothetical protein